MASCTPAVFSYSFDPSSSPKDMVRSLIGDVDEKCPLLYDAEILALLSIYNGDPMNTAIRACEAIIARLGRQVTQTVGSVSITLSDQIKNFRDIRAMLKERQALENMQVYAGGISKADKNNNRQNSDRVQPIFTRHTLEDSRYAVRGPQDYESDGEPALVTEGE